MHNMTPNKSKGVHAEEDILNFPYITQRIYFYPSKENNCGDDYSTVLIGYEHLGETIISGNTYLRGNIITERRDLVLSPPHIGLHTGDKKYCI